ncbi:MAG: ABC transporter permease [Thermomicrobiales bacterium]|nr:ABC transporter permease [Thermomicrobiales bacterium]MCO5220481.1 ABC transporter permease [Thermomicrobiales bacterium]
MPVAVLIVAVLAVISIAIGVYSLDWRSVLSGDGVDHSTMVLIESRVPRTIAVILAGATLAIAGLIMQLLVRNRFVEPSLAGTTESATLGLLAVAIFAPGIPIFAKMLVASCFALMGTFVFLAILRQIPLRSPLMVPLIGIMLGGIISSVTTFFAYRYDLLQSLSAWTTGDFSSMLRGRYELLWLAGGLALLAYIASDRFTVAGMGEEFTTNLGLNYRLVMISGMAIVAMVTAVDVVTVGAIPFLGLVVPNLVRLVMGDNARMSIPWIAVSGAGFVLLCDIVGRTIRYPFEIPISVMVGVIGSAIFLVLLLWRAPRVG